MTDQNRNRDQQNRGKQRSQESQHTAPRHDDESVDQGMGSTSRNRSNRESAETAKDRGTERESFSDTSDREDLGTELEDSRSLEDTDDLDDELGGTGRSNR